MSIIVFNAAKPGVGLVQVLGGKKFLQKFLVWASNYSKGGIIACENSEQEVFPLLCGIQVKWFLRLLGASEPGHTQAQWFQRLGEGEGGLGDPIAH